MFDFAIVGSGAAGGILAHGLTRSGARCVLLEAGREFTSQQLPAAEIDYSAQMYWRGGLEPTADGRLVLLRGKCLGGTTVLNNALLDRFDERVWSEWSARSGVSFRNGEDLRPHYDAVEELLGPRIVPQHSWNRNARLFVGACDALGYEWQPLLRGDRDCQDGRGNDCIACLGGCPRESKRSTLLVAIRPAIARGLAVETEFEVRSVAHHDDHVTVLGTQRGQRSEVRARRAIMSAGALGTSEILLRSGLGRSLPALGRGFSCHPQYVTYGLFDDVVDGHRGPFQAATSKDERFRTKGFKLENVIVPPIGTALLVERVGRRHQELMSRYRHLAAIEVAVRDEPTGRLRLDRGGRHLVVEKRLCADDRARAQAGLGVVAELLQAAGAREIVPCRQPFGLHLMGGCAMGMDPATSVVNASFEVHGFPNLHVVDSSIFPSAPGLNPSFTIMALAHKAVGTLVGES